MPVNATDISLIFLGILIIMVLLEVRKLSRKPEPVSRLEQQFERLSQQMERIRPMDLDLPGGAQIVEAGRNFETITEQLERLGESPDDFDSAVLSEDAVRRFTAGLKQLRSDLAAAQELFEVAARGLGQASDAMLSAGSTLQRIDTQLEQILVPTARSHRGDENGGVMDAGAPRRTADEGEA